MFPCLVNNHTIISNQQEVTIPKDWIKKGYVYIHPRDKFTYPLSLYEDDPILFHNSTKLRRSEEDVTNWGLQFPSFLKNHIMSEMRSRELLYHRQGPSPLDQYINKLASCKITQYCYEQEKDNYLDDKDFILLVKLVNCENVCWRRVRVPCHMLMSLFHDVVLSPVMGWARNYHGYAMTDPTDGSVFGPKNNIVSSSNHRDMKYGPLRYYGVADNTGLPLSLMLKETHDYCYYIYNLDHQFIHHIEVEGVVSSRGIYSILLMDGAGACPPEDSMGLECKGNKGYSLFIEEYSKNPDMKSCKKVIARASYARNYQSHWLTRIPVLFNPMRYSLESYRYILESLLNDLIRKKSGRTEKNNKEWPSCGYCFDKIISSFLCDGCRKTLYCCRECRLIDARRHKRSCK